MSGLSMPDGYADTVQALGWLHWEPRYIRVVWELWRLADRYVFFDVRLACRPEEAGTKRQKLVYLGEWDGETTTPYVILQFDELAGLLVDMAPASIFGYGYKGDPAGVLDFDHQVCFATFVLEKASVGHAPKHPSVSIDLPLEWPSALTRRVRQACS